MDETVSQEIDESKIAENGERLTIPRNVRIMFRVTDLYYATLATVSRCGMVWFSEDVLSTDMIFTN